MSKILVKLFGSADRVKIMRLFLLNPDDVFNPKGVSKRAKVKIDSVKKELRMFSGIGFICKKTLKIESEDKKTKKKIEGWSLDFSFPLLDSLRKLVLDSAPLSSAEFLNKVRKTGVIKLVVLSGIFIQTEDSRVDILIVGDKIKKIKLERLLKEVEAEVGKELRYAIFETEDFLYRLNIYDKFMRDILDYPHQKLLNKLNL